MSYEQAQTNLEIAFDWLNPMRGRRDIDALAELLHPDLAWIDVAGNLACDGREQALAWLRRTPNELNEVDAIELLANEEHVMFGVRNHTRHELAGVELEDGRVHEQGGPAMLYVGSYAISSRWCSSAIARWTI